MISGEVVSLVNMQIFVWRRIFTDIWLVRPGEEETCSIGVSRLNGCRLKSVKSVPGLVGKIKSGHRAMTQPPDAADDAMPDPAADLARFPQPRAHPHQIVCAERKLWLVQIQNPRAKGIIYRAASRADGRR